MKFESNKTEDSNQVELYKNEGYMPLKLITKGAINL